MPDNRRGVRRGESNRAPIMRAPSEQGAGEDPPVPLHVLARLGRLWRGRSDDLADSLEGGDRIAQLHALRGLGFLSARRRRQLEPSLLRLLATAEEEVRREARRAMRGLYSLEQVQQRIEHGAPEQRAAALRDEATIPLLFREAAGSDAVVRDAAVAELVAIGGEQVVCGAIEALQVDDPGMHGAAVEVLRAMGEAASSLLVRALGAPQREVRFGAIKALEVIRASQACPHLVSLLNDPVEEIRGQAARVLAAMRHHDAVPNLARALNDPAQSVRMEAATALATFGGPEGVQGLLEFLRRCSEDLSFEVADQGFLTAVAAMPDLPAAGYQGVLEGDNQPFAVSMALALEDAGTVNRWLQSIPEAAADERRTLMSLLEAVARLGVREPFMEGLSLPDPELRGLSAWLLGVCRHGEAVGALTGLLSDTSALVRRRAVEALGEIRDPACAGALSAALGDPDREVRAAAVAALADMVETGAISPSAQTTDIMLAAEAEQHQLPAPRQAALPDPRRSSYSLPARVTDVLGGLARISTDAAQMGVDNVLSGASALVRALHDPAENVRTQVSEALGRLGIDSAAHDLLDRALHDDSPVVRSSAARSLGKLNASEVAPALIKSLQHDDPDLRRRAAEALGELGDPLAGPALVAALEDASPPVRQKAARSLWQIADSSLVESLREHLHNPDPKIRCAVTGALGRLRALHALEAIAGRLEDPSKYVRASALGALAAVGAEARHLQPRIAGRLADSDPFVRARAAQALAEIGEPGDEQTRMLLAALDDGAEEVRRTARASLLQLANAGAVGGMVQALGDDHHRERVRSIFLQTDLAVMRSLLTTARQAGDEVGPALLGIVADALRERGSIEDYRRDLMSLDPTVRLAGLEALALLRTSEAIDHITSVLFSDPLPALREKAALILAETDDPAALAALKRARDIIPQREQSAAGRSWPGAGSA